MNKKKKRISSKRIKIVVAVMLTILIGVELSYIITYNVSRVMKSNEQITKNMDEVQGTESDTAKPEEFAAESTGDGGAEARGGAIPERPKSDAAEQRRIAAAKAKIIVLDPGHGKSSSLMSADEKKAYGWVQNSKGAWGEWRHYKTGTTDVDCEAAGCNKRVPKNGACWYPIGNGDRNYEPDINLKNALAARHYLEELGYSVRMTRTSNDENPSITRRLEYCYPDGDKNKAPDAALFLCIHSNGGGSRGTSYIQLDGKYDQAWIEEGYVTESNKLGKMCNDKIAENTSLKNNGPITFEPELIAFCKSPVTCGYLEIGFFDNKADKAILDSEYDNIGKSIAMGIDAYLRSK